MKEKGTACDISRAASDPTLESRAAHPKSQQTHNSSQLDQVDFSFIALQATQDDVKKLIGALYVAGQYLLNIIFSW